MNYYCYYVNISICIISIISEYCVCGQNSYLDLSDFQSTI